MCLYFIIKRILFWLNILCIKRGGGFRIGLEISRNLPFPAAGKQGVRENSSKGNHVTIIALVHFF